MPPARRADGPDDWNGRWVSERLGLVLRSDDDGSDNDRSGGGRAEGSISGDLDVHALVGLAVRRNRRRAHLLVSQVLGKHVPTDPRIVVGAGRVLGLAVAATLAAPATSARRDAGAVFDRAAGLLALGVRRREDRASCERALDVLLDLCDRVLPAGHRPGVIVIGFAETATALGHCVAEQLDAPYLHSTRRTDSGVDVALEFAEEHSHAVDHLLCPSDPDLLAGTGPLVLVDDELSTGRTAANTIRALHTRWPRRRYVVAGLVDVRPEQSTGPDPLDVLRHELDVVVDVVALARGSVQLPPDVLDRAGELVQRASEPAGAALAALRPPGAVTEHRDVWPAGVALGGRHGVRPDAGRPTSIAAAAGRLAGALALADGSRVLMLGTEELMWAPLQLAHGVQRVSATHASDAAPGVTVAFSSTTRSPALAVDDPGYAIGSALSFVDPETGVGQRYAYNVADRDWDVIVVVVDERSDTVHLRAPDGLVEQLRRCAPDVRVVVLAETDTETTTDADPTGTPLYGPHFGSYRHADVAWLLTDLSDVELEAPVEEREEAIQAGAAHYAESLPLEYQPGADYQELYRAALRESADRVATAVGVVTELVLAERGAGVVLASLARAGTPIGVLMRRWAAFAHHLDLPHYAVSIVRGRGIDPVALDHLAARHDPGSVVFVDGWTGKGAIVRELRAAVETVNAATGTSFSPELAVLADPGGCVRTFGTRADFLIPSACLNSTVSGLISRTVLNDALIGPGQFHGAKFYRELAGADVSQSFVDTVAARFPAVLAAVDDASGHRTDAQRTPTWAGWAAVEGISRRYGIDDVNLVKPGVGETTRVLLRRVPWRILVRPDARAELAHVEWLAERRGVPIEAVDDLPYSCVGLIHPRYTRGATGADGRAVAQ